jgi:hypothetical protein
MKGNPSAVAGGANQRGGIWLEDCHGDQVRIERCYIHDIRDYAINIYSSTNVSVNFNRVLNVGQGGGWQAINIDNYGISGVYSAYGDVYCIGNYVENTPNGGIAISSSNPPPSDSIRAQTRSYIMWNTVKSCSWVGIAIETPYTQQGMIAYNQVYNCWVGIQVGTGGGTSYNWTDRPRWYMVANNLVDHQGRLSGAVGTGGCILITGGRCTISGNMLRPGACSAVRVDIAGGQTEHVIVSDNLIEAGAHSQTANVDGVIYCNNAFNCLIEGNDIWRHYTRVHGAQTVAASGNLHVETVEGFAASGTIQVNGVQLTYTSVTPATPTTDAYITLGGTGVTVADGDQVYQGGCGAGIYQQFCTDLTIQDNQIKGMGYYGCQIGNGCVRPVFRNNKINLPHTQNAAGTKAAIYVNLNTLSPTYEGNHIVGGATAGGTATIGIYQEASNACHAVFTNNQFDGYATTINPGGVNGIAMDRNNRKSFTDVPNGGTFTSTPGAVTTLNIPHGLATAPTGKSVERGDANARGAPAYHVTADGTNLILNFASALTAATSYTWNWTAFV